MPIIPNTYRLRWRQSWPDEFARLHSWTIAAIAGVTLFAAPWLWAQPPAAVAVAATALILAGVPHGAVDHRIARPLLRPIFGRTWFAPFTLTYLGVAAIIFAGWLVAPALSLLAFLAVSLLHFGTEDAEGRGSIAMLARGGAPIALPILLHPDRTSRFFETLGGTEEAFAFLRIATVFWLPVLAVFLLGLARRRAPLREWAELAAIGAAFAALPPLPAFAFYFLVVHSPRHTAELARRHAPSEARRGWRWAAAQSLPLTAATFVLGATIFFLLQGSLEERFLRTTFWGLAALTVPHMILHYLDRRAGSLRLT